MSVLTEKDTSDGDVLFLFNFKSQQIGQKSRIVSRVGDRDGEMQGETRNQNSRPSLAPECVCEPKKASSDLSSKAAGKRLKAFWVHRRDEARR